MNVFSGSRRIAIVAGTLWVIACLVEVITHQTRVYARYDFFEGNKFANFIGFDLDSCPGEADERYLDFHTESGHPIGITFCIYSSSISIPEGYVLDDPTFLLKDSNYLNSDLAAKRKLFNTHVAQSTDYLSANQATKKAIRERFGVDEIQVEKKKLAEAPFDPDVYLAELGPERGLDDSLKISKEEDRRLKDKWWESWRSAYSEKFGKMLGGLIALWSFSVAMGWIVRGFLGISRGMDSRS